MLCAKKFKCYNGAVATNGRPKPLKYLALMMLNVDLDEIDMFNTKVADKFVADADRKFDSPFVSGGDEAARAEISGVIQKIGKCISPVTEANRMDFNIVQTIQCNVASQSLGDVGRRLEANDSRKEMCQIDRVVSNVGTDVQHGGAGSSAIEPLDRLKKMQLVSSVDEDALVDRLVRVKFEMSSIRRMMDKRLAAGLPIP